MKLNCPFSPEESITLDGPRIHLMPSCSVSIDMVQFPGNNCTSEIPEESVGVSSTSPRPSSDRAMIFFPSRGEFCPSVRLTVNDATSIVANDRSADALSDDDSIWDLSVSVAPSLLVRDSTLKIQSPCEI